MTEYPDVRVESPFPDYALPRVWRWTRDFIWNVSDDFGPKTLDEFMLQMATTPQQTWGVWSYGELGGIVGFQPSTPILGQTHCIFKKSFWGTGVSSIGMQMIFDEIFLAGFEKITANVFERNSQMIRFSQNLGFCREGRMRKHTMQQGKLVNMVALGLLKEDFYAMVSSSSRSVSAIRVPERPLEDNHVAKLDDAHVLTGSSGVASLP